MSCPLIFVLRFAESLFALRYLTPALAPFVRFPLTFITRQPPEDGEPEPIFILRYPSYAMRFFAASRPPIVAARDAEASLA